MAVRDGFFDVGERLSKSFNTECARHRLGTARDETLNQLCDRIHPRVRRYIRRICHREFGIDEHARSHLEQEVFGKRILITNREEWSDEEIMLAYRGQSEVEDVFRQTKDDDHLAVRPQYHWTDQKIHIHTFICLLGLLLARIVELESRKLGRTECLSGLLDLLGSVRLAMILRPSGKKGGRPRCQWQLEEAEPGILDYFLKLVPAEPPFVYTPPSS